MVPPHAVGQARCVEYRFALYRARTCSRRELFLILIQVFGTHAAAAIGPDVVIKVFLPIVIRKFFAGLNIFNRKYEDAPSLYFRFTVWLARVIDIARFIRAGLAIYGLIF